MVLVLVLSWKRKMPSRLGGNSSDQPRLTWPRRLHRPGKKDLFITIFLFISIRALFGTDGTKNAVHGSDSEVSAKREIEIVFGSSITSSNATAVGAATSVKNLVAAAEASNAAATVAEEAKTSQEPNAPEPQA